MSLTKIQRIFAVLSVLAGLALAQDALADKKPRAKKGGGNSTDVPVSWGNGSGGSRK